MRDLFYGVLTCSAAMTVISFAVYIFQGLTKKIYSPRSHYYIWIIVLAGFAIPFRPSLSQSFVDENIRPIGQYFVQPAQAVQNQMAKNEEQPVEVGFTKTVRNVAISPSMAAAIIWGAGAFVVMAYHFYQHFRFTRFVRRWSHKDTDGDMEDCLRAVAQTLHIHTDVSLKITMFIPSPMLIGVFRPQILMPPKAFDTEELYYVLKHELVHYKRKDVLIKFISVGARAVHWFNPMVYMVAKAADTACEVSCDAEVVKNEPKENRLRYTETILGVIKYQAKLNTTLSTNFTGGKRNMKKRINTIMDTTRKRAGAIMVGLALFGTLGVSTIAASAVIAQDKAVNVVAVLEQDGIRWSVEQARLENGMLYLDTKLMDTTGERLNFSEAETMNFYQQELVNLKPLEKEGILNAMGIGFGEYDVENQALAIYLDIDVSAYLGETAVSIGFEDLKIRDAKYGGDWIITLTLPEESWVSQKRYMFGEAVVVNGLPLVEGAITLCPPSYGEDSIYIEGLGENVTKYSVDNKGSISVLFKDGSEKKLKVTGGSSEDLTEGMLGYFEQFHFLAPENFNPGNSTHVVKILLALEDGGTFTLDEINNLEGFVINEKVIKVTAE